MKKYEGYALITGGNGGLGSEFAKNLASKGYDLILVAKNKETLETTKTQIVKDFGVDVITISQDLTKAESTDIIFDELQKRKIHVGLLVHCTGLGGFNYFHEFERNFLIDTIKLSCISVTDLTYKFLDPMLKKGSGGIIFMSGLTAAISAAPLWGMRGPTKSFLVNLGTMLHAECSSKGVDVMAVCPGFTDTTILDKDGVRNTKKTLLTPKEVINRTLDALGKEIVLIIPNQDIKQKIMLKLMNVISYGFAEKLIKKYTKDELGVDL